MPRRCAAFVHSEMVPRLPLLLGSIALAAALAGAGHWLEHRATQSIDASLPGEGLVAVGVKVAGEPIPTSRQYEAFVQARADSLLDRKVAVAYEGKPLGAYSLRDLGAQVDVESAIESIEKVAHEGDRYRRAAEARAAQRGRFDVALPVRLPVEGLAGELEMIKEELDRMPRAARRSVDREAAKDVVVPHEEGAYLDVYALTEAILATALEDDPRVEIEPFRAVPGATTDAVAKADISTVVASFETRFGGPVGRNRNIDRATAQLHGLVLMPGEVVSFNDTVGPRSIDNGFFSAPEIYKGEMREGIGGGVCQVASTLYAAAFHGGFGVIERRNHSRPSGYIRPGMDATVSFPVLDLRIKNPYDFPVVVSAKSDGGVLRFELLGKERRVEVALATETLGVLKYSRKLEKAPFLPAGEFRVKQKGRRGLSIKRLKTITDLKTGEATLEESKDLYPPAQEILLVGPETSEDDLPPLEPLEKPSDPDMSESTSDVGAQAPDQGA